MVFTELDWTIAKWLLNVKPLSTSGIVNITNNVSDTTKPES